MHGPVEVRVEAVLVLDVVLAVAGDLSVDDCRAERERLARLRYLKAKLHLVHVLKVCVYTVLQFRI